MTADRFAGVLTQRWFADDYPEDDDVSFMVGRSSWKGVEIVEDDDFVDVKLIPQWMTGWIGTNCIARTQCGEVHI